LAYTGRKERCGVEMREYEDLITKLDGKVQEAKRLRREREEAKKRLDKVRHYMQGIEAKVEELSKLGVSVPSEAMEQLLLLKKEEQELLEKLERLPQISGEVENGSRQLQDDDKDEIEDLLDKVDRSELGDLSQEERWAIFRIWAARWRIVAERVGPELTSSSYHMRKAYARIVETMNQYPGPESRFFPALSRDRHHGDWEKELRDAKENLEAVSQRMLRRRTAEEELDSLRSLMPEIDPATMQPDMVRVLQHKVRMIAREVSLRDDLAALFVGEGYRKLLGQDFDFLWKQENGDKPEEASKDLNRSQILWRLLKRMLSKTLIGGCHGPLEGVCSGFPEHQKGLAREAMGILIRNKVVRHRSTPYGDRVAIEPSMVTRVRTFTEAHDPPSVASIFGIEDLRQWAQQS
jgi:hypothetical protein